MKNLSDKFREGGIKSVVLAAAVMLATGAAEAYRAGEIQSAIALSLGALAAFGTHEALSQYQFEFSEDARDRIADALPGVERDPEQTSTEDDA